MVVYQGGLCSIFFNYYRLLAKVSRVLWQSRCDTKQSMQAGSKEGPGCLNRVERLSIWE